MTAWLMGHVYWGEFTRLEVLLILGGLWNALNVDGEMPFEICSGVKTRERAEFEAEKFVARMSHPEIGVWWVEITEGEVWS